MVTAEVKTKERPIVFSGPMINAIREDRKSQTRRPMKPQPWYGGRVPDGPHIKWPPGYDRYNVVEGGHNFYVLPDSRNTLMLSQCPYGRVGARLWVQEGYQITAFDRDDPRQEISGFYLADSAPFNELPLTDAEWRLLCARRFPHRATPGRFMYRSLSRLTIELADVRVERLQEISEEDAEVEGPTPLDCGSLGFEKWASAFRNLWIDIHGHGSWELNEWVWALSFKRV